MKSKYTLGVIPARMKSSRFPGKPLADIHGKPMVIRVYEASKKASSLDDVVVATDSPEIEAVCKQYNAKVEMTRGDHSTGTDRIAEIAQKIEADIYVNIQGDEPLIEPETVSIPAETLKEEDSYEVVNLCAEIDKPSDLVDATVPKVVKTDKGKAIFLSRAAVPYPKNPGECKFYRQVCVYAFSRKSLLLFSELPQGNVEKAEEIELLRFIANDIPVKMVEVKTRSFGVDTPADLERAKKEFKE